MKPKFLFFVIVIAAVVAYTQMPGLKAKANRLANEYGGWNQEAIEDDPVGFIDHAKSELTKSIAAFKESRDSLATSKQTAEAELKKFKDQLESSDSLASILKENYRSAKANESFPVTILGESYSESDLVDQVEKLLATKANAQARLADYESILAQVKTKRSQLDDRISQSEMKLTELDAKREMVKVDSQTALADKLLAQVNEVVQENGKLAKGTGHGPVRSVEELMAAAEKAAETTVTPAPKADALAFLNN